MLSFRSAVRSPSSAAVGEHPVIAGYRGLDSADAIQLGALLAGALDEPLVLAGAGCEEPVRIGAGPRPGPDGGRHAGGAAQTALRRARAYAATQIELREATVPSIGVGEALVDLARDVDACMLVLGRDTQGYVTRWLLPRAPCPVAVAPLSVPLAQVGPLRRIGAAYDGSRAAQCAVVVAARLARAAGAHLVLLAAGTTSEQASTWLDIARLSLDRDVESFETRALAGEAPAALAHASEELDLLVCGSCGRGRPLAQILGTVSAQLVDHARCPVVVVPPVVWVTDSGPLGIASAAAIA